MRQWPKQKTNAQVSGFSHGSFAVKSFLGLFKVSKIFFDLFKVSEMTIFNYDLFKVSDSSVKWSDPGNFLKARFVIFRCQKYVKKGTWK